MATVVITRENFEAEVVKSAKPVLVDFWASWCGPCKMLSPVVDQIAEETDAVKIGKINVDDEPELANQFGINSIPAVYLFKDGQGANKSVGLMPKAKVLEFIGV